MLMSNICLKDWNIFDGYWIIFYFEIKDNLIFNDFQDPSAHMNLGAMLHLVGKLEEAEEKYLAAW